MGVRAANVTPSAVPLPEKPVRPGPHQEGVLMEGAKSPVSPGCQVVLGLKTPFSLPGWVGRGVDKDG